MRNLSDTIARLSAMRTMAAGTPTAARDRLTDLPNLGTNPGALRALAYIPVSLAEDAALVVVLHGCSQNAAGYDTASGWSQLADRHGFALLFPEQTRSNNANLCFNWFQPEDSGRGAGEALSIRQMIGAMIEAHAIDPARIFITGLSAGGAMTSVMLATYPELFAGGAIVAGLPYGTANTMPHAFDRMRGHGIPGERALADLVRAASGHEGPWPSISVWHGTADTTVSHANADAIVAQWRPLHGLQRVPTRQEDVDGFPHRVWSDASGRARIEEYAITGMNHGTPLATLGEEGCGQAAPYMLEAGISSTRHIAAFWGLTEAVVAAGEVPDRKAPRPVDNSVESARAGLSPSRKPSPAPTGVGQIIEDALRAAGLMR
jgi:poly(hydroxyalkanoate) depolymerase family esterase